MQVRNLPALPSWSRRYRPVNRRPAKSPAVLPHQNFSLSASLEAQTFLSPRRTNHNEPKRNRHNTNTMVRKLKHHEQKLLKKVDFVTYKKDEHRDAEVIRRYMIQKPEDYHKYNRLCGVSLPRPGPPRAP